MSTHLVVSQFECTDFWILCPSRNIRALDYVWQVEGHEHDEVRVDTSFGSVLYAGLGAVGGREPYRSQLSSGELPPWNLKDGGSSSGPNIAAEVTPIENWLELEAGVTPLFGGPTQQNGIPTFSSKSPGPFPQSRVYVRCWSRVDSYDREQDDNKFNRR